MEAFLAARLSSREHEVFALILLDAQHRLITYEDLCTGTINEKQSVLSATEQGSLHDMMSQFGLSHYFDFVFGIADRLAGSKVQRGHDLIGDTDHDLEVGHALGVSVLLVTHGHQSAERLKRLHHDVIDVSAL